MTGSSARAHHSINTRWQLDAPLDDWDRRANCRNYPHLPWTADVMPNARAMRAMVGVCDNCPVRRRCAQFGLSSDDLGGVYAGVYLTWKPTGRESRDIFRRARAKLLSKLLAETPGDNQ